ncbi:MAG: ATP-binding protein [Elusimicrobia bacterium]|nr:ATP-binding protein [Elusimicrobiota bacterium]
MVFIGGPRQVGKTTFALSLLRTPPKNETHPAYMNWDRDDHRKRLLNGEMPSGEEIVLLDEIHKFARWRNLVKGLYDTQKSKLSILVTGSARLDYYRKGGDSLQGRYHYYRLHPVSLRELDPSANAQTVRLLLRFGGFPEPLFAGSEVEHRRWQKEHQDRVIRDDLRDLEQVREVSLIELLAHHLPRCVSSPLSVRSLSELLQVAQETAERWLTILERLYFCFRIAPYGSARIRAVKKERKLYLWDWSQAPEGGPRFENMVASQLLKYCHWLEDTQGHRMELRYLRDTDKREVDFVVLRDEVAEFAVECKTGERGVSPAAAYFKARTAIGTFYQVHLGSKDFTHGVSGVRVLPFERFCEERELP